MYKKWISLLMAVFLLIALAGCGSDEAQSVPQGQSAGSASQPSAQQPSPSSATSGEGEQTGFPVTLADGSGAEVVIEKRPERIASVTLGTDEILLSLVDKQRLVAVTQYSTDPGISNVAGQTDDIAAKIESSNAEQIIALNPDLVLVASYTSPDVVKQLRDAGLTVFMFSFVDSIDQMKENILTIGKVVGEEEKAKQIVADMDARLAAVAEKVEKIDDRPTVLNYTPDGYTGGKGTSNDDIITRAGGINLAAEAGIEGWKQISLEKVVELNPDVILLSDWNPGHPNFAETLRNDPILKNVAAVEESRVVTVPGKHLTAVTQYVVNGVEDVYNVLYQ
ncbi:helical backbone metal receptor [Brevibacillus humidisoli]|uniref:helical backbone metal receptor n=1 Tax=Brevibacillus humidisoli TaxID=2895522 RepID=UPI001E3E1B64|nr:helical backbone metal receptor [Brevibacillus humidisoli]UFJ40244.1 helical backbone metal receptor [Brevibacillus humidisoli]